jgi:lipoprotein-releasing system permease protein
MGASQDQVSAIFMAEGLLIGTLGVLFGVICAGVLSFFLKRYEFIQLPDIYYDRTLPVTFEPTYYAVVAVSTFLIVLLACLYPSRRAAALDPLEGIRLGK